MENQHRLITGYRDLDENEVRLMNEIKAVAAKVEALVDEIHGTKGVDIRWAAIAETDLQKGFMALVRSVAKPESF